MCRVPWSVLEGSEGAKRLGGERRGGVKRFLRVERSDLE